MFLAPIISRHPKMGRWIYATVAALGAVGFTRAFFYKVTHSNLSTNNKLYEFLLWIAIIAFLAGLICWPRKKRGTGRMVFAGILTVATAFLIFPFSEVLFNDGWSELKNIGKFWRLSFGMLLLGSIFTFGIPYIIGIVLSLLFIDVDYVVDKKQNKI